MPSTNGFFEPNTWYPISDFPEDWKGKEINVDLWVVDGTTASRACNCSYSTMWNEWVPDDGPNVAPEIVTHFMRVAGPQ
jgi:hypothetical protein